MQQPSVSVDHHTASFDWRTRLRAAAIHLALSALVAMLAGVLVFALWYPFPYRDVSGGSELFRLVVAVDVVLGPLITFAVFNRAKPRKELRREVRSQLHKNADLRQPPRAAARPAEPPRLRSKAATPSSEQ